MSKSRSVAGGPPGPGLMALLGLLFALSGATALVYEVVWFRLIYLRLGGTGLSVATVTATFMGGLGLGAWLFGRRLGRHIQPVRLYALLEAFIGIYALFVPTLMAVASQIDGALLDAESAGALSRLIRYLLMGAVLLPATLCMGGTLPVLARLVESGGLRPGRFVGALYGLNTSGAVLGAAGAGFILLPQLGFATTVQACAIANLLLAAAAFAVARMFPEQSGSAVPAAPAPQAPAAPTAQAQPGLALLAYATSGLTAFMLQVSWTRILSLVFASSLYAFSLIVAIFLAGLGLGALLSAPFLDRVQSPRRALAWTLSSAGAMAVLGQWLYPQLPGFYLEGLLAHGTGMALGTASLLALVIMLPATVLLGMGFPLAVRLASGDSSANIATQVGRLYAANTSGSVVGAFATALFLIPALGLSGVVSLAGGLAMLLGAALGLGRIPERPRPSWGPAGLALATLLLWGTLIPGWNSNLMSDSVAFWGYYSKALGAEKLRERLALLATGAGPDMLFYKDGVTASVAVKEFADSRFISVDGKVDASSLADMRTQIFLGQLPMLLANEPPQDVLIIGLASGVTLGSVLTHPMRQAVSLEIEEAVHQATTLFDDVNGRPLEDPRSLVVVEDARAYVERSQRTFDVIISEPSSAWLSGSARLFTREAFAAYRRRLNPGGLLCQWLQTYDLNEEAVAGVVRTLQQEFPHVAVFKGNEPDLLLIASDRPIQVTPQTLARRLVVEAVQNDLARVGANSPCRLLDALVADPQAVAATTGSGPLNTDDNAWVEVLGPYTSGTTGGELFEARLRQAAKGAAAILDGLAPDGPIQPGTLAASCLEEGAIHTAASLARHQLTLGPDSAASFTLGESLRRLSRRSEAVPHFETAATGPRALDAAHIGRATNLHELGRLQESLTAWETAAAVLPPSDPILLAGRGRTRLAAGDAGGALTDLLAIRAAGGRLSMELQVDLIRALLADEQPARARQELETMLANNPDSRSGGLSMAAARHWLAGLLTAEDADGERRLQLQQEADQLRTGVSGSILLEAQRRHSADGMVSATAYLQDLHRRDPGLAPILIETLTKQIMNEKLDADLKAAVQKLAASAPQPR